MHSSLWITCCFFLFALVQITECAPTNRTAYFDAFYCDTIPVNNRTNWTATATSQLFNDFFLNSVNYGQAAPVYCHNFNFSIPQDAVVSALTMQQSRYYSTQYNAGPIQDITGSFIVASLESNNFFRSDAWPKDTAGVFETTCCSLWGFYSGVTPKQINSDLFGLKLLVGSVSSPYNTDIQMHIFNMSITVFYDDCENSTRCPDMYPNTPYCINGGCNNCTADLSFCATVNSSLPYCNPMTGMCEVQPPMSPPVTTPEASNAPQNGNQPSTQQQPSSTPQSNDSPMSQPSSRTPTRRVSDTNRLTLTPVTLTALIGGLFMLV